MAPDMDADIRVKIYYWEYLLEGLSLLSMTESTIILPLEVKKYTQIVNPLSFMLKLLLSLQILEDLRLKN